MGTIERSVEVGRSAADVWTVLEDVRRIPTYSPSTVAVSDAPERLSAVGQRFRQTIMVLGRRFESDWTVTELQPGRRVALEGTVGVGARYCLVEEVEPRGPDRSLLTVRITFTMPLGLLGRVADALGAQRRAQREAEEVLANLKVHLEASDGGKECRKRTMRIERVTVVEGAAAVVDPLFREYGLWVADQLFAHHGMRFSEAEMERHHAAFRAEIPGLVGPRGRLLLAHIGDEPVGVGSLKPVDGRTGEIKRMYVRPAARGQGVGRALLERLVADARADGYGVLRLESLDFMKEAHTLYRSLGFVDTALFDGSEAVAAGVESFTHYLELEL